MRSDTAVSPPASLPLGRLAGIGSIIFLANAALLVLQLVAGRLLAPFVGSSLETWTSVIGVFLTGIALGNAVGGRIADRYPSPRTLALLLLAGAVAALWMVAFPEFLASSGIYKSLPLGPRIPVLAFVLCLPAGFMLSLLTPLAIKLGLPDVSKTGRVAGMIFALSTLGCLLGNYVTGFYLMEAFFYNTLVFMAAGSLVVLAAWAMIALKETPIATPTETSELSVATAVESSLNPHAFRDIRLAYLIVFCASFGGMTLELTGSRLLAQHLGVSLFTWTGVIGVMLAGTALGNLTGGILADRVNRPGSKSNPRSVLGGTLISAGAATVLVFVSLAIVQRSQFVDELDPITQVMVWTFSLFFLPMFILGMISPQVIRLAVPDTAHVGRIAGRVYAVSTTGAIFGTFAAGYFLLSTLGWSNTLLAVAVLLSFTSLVVAKVWQSSFMLYLFSIVLGGVTGGFILSSRNNASNPDFIAQLETNYYTIKVTHGRDILGHRTPIRTLTLDHLVHSSVDPDNPNFLYYEHEHVQMEFIRAARAGSTVPRVLVIGGGGYTLPRYAMEMLPETRMDVVEIDPGVTQVAREHLGLKEYEGLEIVHMDGRQFLAEKVEPGTYDVVIQDAVNDLSVPSHLLTKEYNDLVKKALKPDGVYLLTVIDATEYGKLWKAAVHTLGKTYPPENIALLTPGVLNMSRRQVYVIYASDKPVDLNLLELAVRDQMGFLEPAAAAATAVGSGSSVAAFGGTAHAMGSGVAAPAIGKKAATVRTFRVPPDYLKPFLEDGEPIILTDQYAPTDNLMADVFRFRYRDRSHEE